ncbi:hypothetical protein K4787_001398 [Salmonella enterica subsp. enterica serovar Saintpaul]|nr:hypothetical protein [Salmonella enterica subsp. enterica]EHY8892166.1 hypothetical protein [Salmonella enterica subsp. enterica serovar Saintpaul]EHY8924036.1 hypothetical protein [Salmonella enterica subsp. enterica serovar Saintpaul]EHY8942152.1 hypothetical protein [Salmonella enterica subsp. enterica serovar Saintpaul]
MNEFNNRIDAQREILSLVNSKVWKEELFGLSSGAIERWVRANSIDPSSKLSCVIRESAGKLFFLANKSQEQITEEYRNLSVEISDLIQKIRSYIQSGE